MDNEANEQSNEQATRPPSEPASLGKRFSIWLLKIALGVAFGVALMAALVFGVPAGMNWRAEKKAESFCQGVKRGADVTTMAHNFEKSLEQNVGEQHILQYEADDAASHTFLFEGFMFDKAACRVAMDKDRKAVSARVLAAQ